MRDMKLPRFSLIFRVAAVFALAFWWGGLTFYSLVAVPIGVDVLGGAVEQGFITRLVTQWINLSGAATIAILIGATCTLWRRVGILARSTLAATLATMATAQAILFALHPKLDAMLDLRNQSVGDPQAFHPLHEFYLTVTGVQWFAGLIYFLTLLICWQE
jgi:hypothetical protein